MNQIIINMFAIILGIFIGSLVGFIIGFVFSKIFGLQFDTKRTIKFIAITSSFVFIYSILKDTLKYYGFSNQTLIFINVAVVIVGILFIMLLCRKKK